MPRPQTNRIRINSEWIEKTISKKIQSKKLKKRKNQSEIAASEQKTTHEKANFCSNTGFSPYFKISVKTFTPQNHSLFPLWARPNSLLQFDFNNHENV